MASREKEKVTVEMPGALRAALAQWAADEDRGISNLLRRIVADAVANRAHKAAPTRKGRQAVA
jgi:hypothetical protein